MSEKKVSTRSKIKNVGLKKGKFSKIKQEFHDIDYVNKLNDEEKQWLSKFMEEDLGARFNHGEENLYKEVEKKREIYRRNNHRNNDVYSVARATGRLSYVTDNTELARLMEAEDGQYDEVITEDDIIGIIDGDFE